MTNIYLDSYSCIDSSQKNMRNEQITSSSQETKKEIGESTYMEKMEGVESSDYVIVEKPLNKSLVPNSEIDMPTSGQEDLMNNNPFVIAVKEEVKQEQAVLYEPDINQIVAAMNEQVVQDVEILN